MSESAKTRVLIADDSLAMRRLLREILSADPAIEVVGAVGDAFEAREAIKQLDPDVLTLDVEMPRMDGLSFLEKLMRLRPMPVVMISAWTEKGADTTMRALMLGAVDFMHKPQLETAAGMTRYAAAICEKVRTAKNCRKPGGLTGAMPVPVVDTGNGELPALIAIGASTGGVEAIARLLGKLPAALPPIVITQHIPPVFSTSFARRLNEQLGSPVIEAKDRDPLLPGHVYIAPGDRHLLVTREQGLTARLRGDAPVNRHMPSVDVMFASVAETVGSSAIGVLLTGMGDDGARGLGAMREAGAVTIAQDKATSVVWGMPGQAVALGATRHVLALDAIAPRITTLCHRPNQQGETGAEYGISSGQPRQGAC